jgi:TRAP-type C4-dicarboxylate transport system substrate-binding protein
MKSEITNNYDATKAMLEAKGNKFNEVDYPAFVAVAEPVYANMKGVTPGIYKTLQAELAKMKK